MSPTTHHLHHLLLASWAMVRETIEEYRGWILPLLVLASGGAVLAVGMRITSPLSSEGGLAPAFFHGGLTVIMILAAIIHGASALAGDRVSGFEQWLKAQSLPGGAYFLGRYLGLAFRLTIITLACALPAGAILAVINPDLEFARGETAVRVFVGSREADLEAWFLLRPEGSGARWCYAGSEADQEDGRERIHFLLRPRYPRGRPFEAKLPIRVTLSRMGVPPHTVDVVIRGRKSLYLPVPKTLLPAGENPGADPLEVKLEVTGGVNYLEVAARDVSRVRSGGGPVTALFDAVLTFLPWLYLALAVTLLFSAFVSAPTALFAGSVLCLTVLLGPDFRTEIALAGGPGAAPLHYRTQKGGFLEAPSIASEQQSRGSTLVRIAAHAVDLLPDTRRGRALEALSRGERPSASNLTSPWFEIWPHLVGALIVGCLLTGRKRG